MATERRQTTDEAQAATQRLDKWLWYARALKSRTMAADLVLAGKVRINRQRVEKPSQMVRQGDVLTITFGGRVRIFKVRAPGARRGPAHEARGLYEDLTPASVETRSVPARRPGAGRPSKRERREIGRFTHKN